MKSVFRYVNVYDIQIKCETPLHVGTGSDTDEKGEVLVHPVSGKPFLQASGISGAFRDYAAKQYPGKCADWFGDSNGHASTVRDASDMRSRLIFSDGAFTSYEMELRTRVSINPDTGTTATVGEGKQKSGQLLETEYISAGAVAKFSVYEFYSDDEEVRILEELFKALDDGLILFGGQLSNGCGEVKIETASVIRCDLKTPEGRKKWGNLDSAERENCLSDIKMKDVAGSSFVDFYMDMVFDQDVLVKGDRIDADKISEIMGYRFREGERLPDKMQMLNGQKKFIIPGSSFKGVFRNHIENIAK